MSLVSPVRYQTNIPPRPPRHAPTSPDSFRATPSSSPNVDRWDPSAPLPYILAPDSRPASPTSQGRIDKLEQQIRNHEVLELYVVCTKLRGPFGPGASRWGIGGGVQEKYDEEDLVLAECEEHAVELERKKLERRAAAASKAPDVHLSPQRREVDALLSSSSRSTTARSATLPVPTLGTPRATSTPAAKRHLSSQLSISQLKLGFTLSKPAVTRTQSKHSRKSSQTPMLPAPRTSSRFFSALQDKPRTTTAQVGSSQPTPFNSQFDVGARVSDLSHLLDEDAFEVDRGVEAAVVISSDDEL
ncbi:hypothetical protein CALVIDRAFT_543322 [Calocera viscosa TUFC12733]|uniref:Uncharacterized protein n=1 Tax=Calocera viscosa (strain TUFC12733) TaxID=1330018 RepID=A0A167FQY3_CALVF|nr:hypothetical protein CALVIDRAFT_543322 [Calocera viscosa TUFC12733]